MLLRNELPRDLLLNVNFPAGEPRGVRLTKLGRRRYQQSVVQKLDPHGREYFWIAGKPVWDESEGSDQDAVAAGYVSITPLHLDLTDYRGISVVRLAPGAAHHDGLIVTPERAYQRRRMVRRLEEDFGIRDPRVLAAFAAVPRHRFVRPHLSAEAYSVHALPIGEAQTISQPSVVARMTELLEVDREHAVLEIGTGSGYQTAILAELARRVYSLEIVASLAREADPPHSRARATTT